MYEYFFKNGQFIEEKRPYLDYRYKNKAKNYEISLSGDEFVPRVTYKRQKNNKTIYSNDFIPISNGEAGQKSKKIQTTALPKEITMNMLVSDRLEDLRKERKPVTRKDLVFMKFYVFSRESEEKGSYTSRQKNSKRNFLTECR